MKDIKKGDRTVRIRRRVVQVRDMNLKIRDRESKVRESKFYSVTIPSGPPPNSTQAQEPILFDLPNLI